MANSIAQKKRNFPNIGIAPTKLTSRDNRLIAIALRNAAEPRLWRRMAARVALAALGEAPAAVGRPLPCEAAQPSDWTA